MWGTLPLLATSPYLSNEIGLPITGAATELSFAPPITAVARLPHNHQCPKSFSARASTRTQ